jgi:alpha-tubulin suppressor-like RCC1 family protein
VAGLAVAVSAPTPARAGIVFQSHVVASWGDNEDGDLGDGTTTIRSLYGDIKLANDVVQVAAGYYFALALRSDGTVWAWGDNGSGQLGDSTRTDRSTPGRVLGPDGVVTQVAAGAMSLALLSDGTVWEWGANDHGQLGDGTRTDSRIPERISGIGTSYIAGVTAGLWTGAVLGTDGSVWGWGDNSVGQLARTPSTAPVTRPASMFASGSGITQLSAGWGHMLALKSNGTVLAWGSNQVGQLGNGTRDPVAGRVQVTGLTATTQVAAGGRGFSLAVHTVPYLVGS